LALRRGDEQVLRSPHKRPVAPETLKADIARLFDTPAAGGPGIDSLDVAYPIVAILPSGTRRIFQAT
jgi:hypothetical protein